MTKKDLVKDQERFFKRLERAAGKKALIMYCHLDHGFGTMGDRNMGSSYSLLKMQQYINVRCEVEAEKLRELIRESTAGPRVVGEKRGVSKEDEAGYFG